MLIVTHYFKDVHSVNKSIYFCFYKFLPELSQHYQRVLPLSVPMSNEVHTPESHMEQSFLKIRIVILFQYIKSKVTQYTCIS